MKRLALPAALLFGSLLASAHADELQMVRAEQAFPEAMTRLQEIITKHDYKVTRVQRVDIGLTSSGYATAEYRIVFFGKPDEMRALPERHPELLPYLPLKIVVFAEGESTLAVAHSPALLGDFYREPALRRQFQRWDRDMRSILDQFAQAP